MIWHFVCFFFNDTATTEIYTLSLHDALPISSFSLTSRSSSAMRARRSAFCVRCARAAASAQRTQKDRKSTRLNSSHSQISYAVFCLKKKNEPFSVKTHVLPVRQRSGRNSP